LASGIVGAPVSLDLLGRTPVLQSLDHVLMFVPSVREAAEWYSSVLRLPVTYLDEAFASITVGSAQLCFHTADIKVPAGRAGQVAYWRVASLTAAAARFQALGAQLYRGPLAIESGLGICQLADPFGNLFGLVGSYDAA
jgi:predicted enzyme related to lactoylglutathione lyase